MTLDSRDLEAQVAAYWKVVASFAATQTPEALVRGAYIDGWLTGVYIGPSEPRGKAAPQAEVSPPRVGL